MKGREGGKRGHSDRLLSTEGREKKTSVKKNEEGFGGKGGFSTLN